MVLNPALLACEFSSHFSGSWTHMNARSPPSSLLRASTAWAVVQEPAKKSNMISSFAHASFINSLSKPLGLGLSNIAKLPSKEDISFDPSVLRGTKSHIVGYVTPVLTSDKKRLSFGLPLPFSPK